MSALVKLLGPQRTIVITDALAGAGLSDATFDFAGQTAHVVHGAAHLADGTITGSVLTMDQALRNVLLMTNVSLQQAVGMLTLNPARSAQVAQRKGLLKSGYDADLTIFDQSMTLQATLCCGKVAFATAEWRERLSPACKSTRHPRSWGNRGQPETLPGYNVRVTLCRPRGISGFNPFASARCSATS